MFFECDPLIEIRTIWQIQISVHFATLPINPLRSINSPAQPCDASAGQSTLFGKNLRL